MKKLTTIFMALVLGVFFLLGCGNGSPSPEEKAKIIKVPKGILSLFAKIGDMFKWEFNSKKLIEISHSRIINGAKIKNALEMNKMPFDTETAVQKTIEYYDSIKI